MRKYASIQNRVLVDYKKFRESILEQVNLLLEARQKSQGNRLKAIQQKHQMQFNETLSNYLKTRTAQFDKKMSKKESDPEEALSDKPTPRVEYPEGGVTARLRSLLRSHSKDLDNQATRNEQAPSSTSRMNKTFTNFGYSSNLVTVEEGKPAFLQKTPERFNSSRGKTPIQKLRSMLTNR